MAHCDLLSGKPLGQLLTKTLPLTATRIQVMVLLLALSLILPSQVRAGMQCYFRCQNGGTLLSPNNIFSHYRCRCPPEFTGPMCQISKSTKKRSSSQSILNDLLQARLSVQREQQRQQEQLAHKEPFLSAEHDAPASMLRQRTRRSGKSFQSLFLRK